MAMGWDSGFAPAGFPLRQGSQSRPAPSGDGTGPGPEQDSRDSCRGIGPSRRDPRVLSFAQASHANGVFAHGTGKGSAARLRRFAGRGSRLWHEFRIAIFPFPRPSAVAALRAFGLGRACLVGGGFLACPPPRSAWHPMRHYACCRCTGGTWVAPLARSAGMPKHRSALRPIRILPFPLSRNRVAGDGTDSRQAAGQPAPRSLVGPPQHLVRNLVGGHMAASRRLEKRRNAGQICGGHGTRQLCGTLSLGHPGHIQGAIRRSAAFARAGRTARSPESACLEQSLCRLPESESRG